MENKIKTTAKIIRKNKIKTIRSGKSKNPMLSKIAVKTKKIKPAKKAFIFGFLVFLPLTRL